MDLSWQAASAVSAVAAILLGSLYFGVFTGKLDPREPPLAKSSIPLIGHAIGISRKSFNYYAQLSRENPFPIFTMLLSGAKMYIVTSPALIQAVQKQPKTLAFPPIEAKFASRICGSSSKAQEILMKNVNGDEGDWGLSMESYVAIKNALTPGSELDGMNRTMMRNTAASFDELETTGPVRLDLVQWLRSEITMATTNSVYGPSNPYKDESVQQGFWDFEKDLMKILIGILPSVVALKGLAGRSRIIRAFTKYFEQKGHEQASILMQNRFKTSFQHGISIQDIAAYEVGGSVAVLVNTVPAAFWTLAYIYSCPEVLEPIRKELLNVISSSKDENGLIMNSIDITALKTDCPLLASTFQEVLRHRSMGTSIRQVMKDTLLDGQWLLKKDSIVQIPSLVLHSDVSIWGSDTTIFNPQRFMRNERNKVDGRKRPHPAAFRAFGGGSTLCPGRHFATNEILAVTSMFVLRFDIKPSAGEWLMPETHNTNTAAVIMEPDTGVEVTISKRQGNIKDRWTFSLKNSEKIVAMAIEDQPR